MQMQPVVALELTMNRVFLAPTTISPATRVSLAVSDVKLASTAAGAAMAGGFHTEHAGVRRNSTQ